VLDLIRGSMSPIARANAAVMGQHRQIVFMPPGAKAAPGIDAAEIFSALPVAALLVSPDNMIADANSRAEALLNMARTAIIGSDIARTVRIDEQNLRIQLWQSDKPLAPMTSRSTRAEMPRSRPM
jgi:PAS domain-containing protein